MNPFILKRRVRAIIKKLRALQKRKKKRNLTPTQRKRVATLRNHLEILKEKKNPKRKGTSASARKEAAENLGTGKLYQLPVKTSSPRASNTNRPMDLAPARLSTKDRRAMMHVAEEVIPKSGRVADYLKDTPFDHSDMAYVEMVKLGKQTTADYTYGKKTITPAMEKLYNKVKSLIKEGKLK